MESKSVIHLVGTDCPSETERELDMFYRQKHLPDIFRFKKLSKATRYRNIHTDSDYPKFLDICEFECREDFQAYDTSLERVAATEDFLDISKRIGASLRWRVQYEIIDTWKR